MLWEGSCERCRGHVAEDHALSAPSRRLASVAIPTSETPTRMLLSSTILNNPKLRKPQSLRWALYVAGTVQNPSHGAHFTQQT